MQHHVYPNGLRFIYESSQNKAPLTYVYLYCNVGSVHEPQHLRGVAHFIEHMCFKGTRDRTNPQDIFVEYDKIGAEFNAFTTKRATCYMIVCQNEYLHNCLSILGDMVLNSTFPKKEYGKEFAVVVEENVDDSNDFQDIIYESSDALLYQGSSYAHPVDSIKYHPKDRPPNYKDVLRFYHTYYQPDNFVMSIVSTMSFGRVQNLISSTGLARQNKGYGSGRMGEKLSICHEVRPQSDIQFHLKTKNGVTNTLLTIGFRTCGMDSPDKYKLELLKTVLIGGMSGRLFMLLREKHGLTYGIEVETEYQEKTGDFTIFTQTDSAKLLRNGGAGKGVLPLIMDCVLDLISTGITEKEFETAKGNLKGNYILKQVRDKHRAEYNGLEWILRDRTENITPCNKIYEKYIHPLCRIDVQEVIRNYFTRDRMTVCLLSEKLPSLGRVKSFFENVPFSGGSA
jgi:predicted Zn-dependent peptidase